MRKYTPVQIPDNTPTGFSKRLSVSEHAPVPPQLITDKEVTRQQQPPLVRADDRAEPLPVPDIQQDSLQTPLHCDPDCCTRVGPKQERNIQAIGAPSPPPTPPSAYQPQPAVYLPMPPPAPQASTTSLVLQAPPSRVPALRRSDRAGRGQTSKYDDFVQQIFYTKLNETRNMRIVY